MIAAGRFVFLHLHKSGGSFVNEYLLRFVPDARQVGYHLPYRLIPPESAGLPVLGFVRNPWSYYVSWYAFQAQSPQPNPLFRILSEQGRLDFEGTVRNMLELGAGGAHLDSLEKALPAGYRNRGLNLPGFELAGIRGTAQGFYSFLHDHIYGGADIRHIGHMEKLREELPNMLIGVGQPVTTSMRELLLEAPPVNTSEHGRYTEYYSKELRALVAQRDERVIDLYGYRFEE